MKDNVDFTDLRDILGTTEYHIADVDETAKMLLDLHARREQIYHKSFAGRGLIGIYMNMARKWDPFESLAQRGQWLHIKMFDAVADLAVYSLKMLTVLRVLDKDSYEAWLRSLAE